MHVVFLTQGMLQTSSGENKMNLSSENIQTHHRTTEIKHNDAILFVVYVVGCLYIFRPRPEMFFFLQQASSTFARPQIVVLLDGHYHTLSKTIF